MREGETQGQGDDTSGKEDMIFLFCESEGVVQ